jgi:sulfide:quinone oxidoreductase
MHRITIVGSGFAGLSAVQTLRDTRLKCGIDLVSPRPELVYLPGTIWGPPRIRRGEAA